MTKGRSRLGIAVAAVLAVACGDAAVGSMLDGGGSVLVDMGQRLVDGGQALQDAGGDVDNGAQAQGPGPWVPVTCDTTQTVTTNYGGGPTDRVTHFARFSAPEEALIEVETCANDPADTDHDGCADSPSGYTCSSSGPPTPCYRTVSHGRDRQDASRVMISCGTIFYGTDGSVTAGSLSTVRYRTR